ncbi:MAG: PKD domain-containing protein [Bacteroidota bacterium]|nr:PKD domain-containing protein [Bacteroidota bacterium]
MKKILLFLFFPTFIYSQSWIENMQDPNNNFYDTQKEFEDYWENRTIEKGKGWKQFKRWENFIAPRVFPDGVQHPDILVEEYNILQEANNQFLMLPPNVWEQVGPDNVPLESSGTKRGIGRVNTIAFHPTDSNIIYVGAPAGGFWKSLNNGQTWSTTTDFLTNLGVSDIAINPSNPDDIYIITGDRDGGDTYSYGLMKSIDGGSTFNITGLSFNVTNYYKGNRVLIDPSNTDIIIVATSNGIYRSVDAGVSFVLTYSGVNMTDIEFHPTNTNIIYGASKGSTSVYKSSDNGVNWSQAGSGLPPINDVVRACVAVTANNPQVVYALFGNNNNGFYGVYKSSDEGLTWTQQSNTPNLLGWSSNGTDNDGQAWYDLAFAVSPTNENILFVGGINTWKSTNGGVNWNLNTHWTGSGGADYMHADEHMLKYNPLNGTIYSGNDGGLYYSTDEVNWEDISDGLHITQFYSLGVSQTVQDMVITGAQDNGTLLKTNLNWDAVIGGDGMECIIDYTNSNIMYGEVYYGAIRKSTNGGNSFSSIAPSNNGAWETPYELDKNNPNIIYAGYDELYKTIDGGNNWNTITNGETNGGKIDEIGLSKSNSDVIYITDYANIFRTTNGGTSWTQINNNLPNKYITYVIVHPTDENKVWVTFSGYTAGEKVYKTIDGGNNWVNISGTLPNIPVNCIELDTTNNLETIYIGTDLGVFISDSTLNDWNQFNNNSLPNVIVNELEIQYQSNKLFAATYGRGLWNIDLQITSPPTANFSYSDSVFCNVPADVTFLNNSYYSNSYYWDFGDGTTSLSTNPTHTYTSFGTFSVQLIATGPLGVDSILKQHIINIDQNNACITTLPISGAGDIQTLCNGTLYDVGGPTSNYYDENDCWITIAPPGSNQITLTFNSFDVEAPSSSLYCNWDYLEIFDGADTTAPSLGQFCNTLTGSPGIIVSTGGAITVLLHSDQAVNGTGFEADWSCVFPSAPPISMFEISDSISCDATISFTDISTNGPLSWLWDFGDGTTSTDQHPIHNYTGSGVFDVKLTTTNQYGIDSIIINSAVTIIDMNLQTTDASACGNTSLVLTANTTVGTINWYDDINLQSLVGVGGVFTTPVLNTTTSYYAQSVYEFASLFGGPNDNNFGSGSYYQGNKYLIFNNYSLSTLVSVLVYADSDAFRTIELRNSSNAVLEDTTVFIPASPNGIRVYLNFDLPVQNNMQLGMSGSNNDMYRNSSGAVFPYNISDIVSITGTNAPVEYYYFFYDWEVKKASCISNISTVIATIDNNTSNTSTITACDSYIWLVNGQTYTSSGTYTDVSTNAFGCIQNDTLNLTIDSISNIIQNLSLCNGDSIIIGGNIYYNAGSYTDLLQTVNGCDSIVNTILSVFPNVNNNQNVLLCSGDSVVVGSHIYYDNGIYTDTFSSFLGCDSILITEVEISDPLANLSFTVATLTAFAAGGLSPYTIELGNQNGSILNSSNIFGNNSVSINPISNGIYYCFVIDANNCISDTVFYQVDIFPSSLEEGDMRGLFIFPNPTTGVVNIRFFNSAITRLSIQNILGENIYNAIITKKSNISKEIDLSNYSSGVYIVELSTDYGIINKKIILE